MLIDFDLLILFLFLAVIMLILLFLKFIFKMSNERLFYILFLCIYLTAVIRLTLFPFYLKCDFASNLKENVNLIPFRKMNIRDMALNLIMMIPMGVFIPFLVLKKRFCFICLTGVIGGIVPESSQLVQAFLSNGFTLRFIDVNDVIANMLGVLTGYMLMKTGASLFVKFGNQPFKEKFEYTNQICRQNRWRRT